jgi:hypothetical protein
MIRKILFAVALWMSAFCVFAQSMTDSQIISFVKQEQAKGEQEIESAEFPDDEVEREDMDDTRVIMTHTPYAETGDEEVED